MEFSINLFKFYDLGSRIERSEIVEKVDDMELNLTRLEKYQIDSDRGEPDYVSYPEPISFTIKEELRSGEEIDIVCKVYTYGTLSLKTVIRPEVADIEGLIGFNEREQMARGVEEVFDQIYNDFFRKFAGGMKKEYRSKNYFTNLYPVYCISNTDYKDVGDLIDNNRKEIASLLIGMYSSREFSEEQIDKVLKHNTRFYQGDYSIVHWNGGLAVDNDADYEDLLYIIELANIQFVKLRAYDDYIDNYLSEYLNLTKRRFGRGIKVFNPASKMIKDITKMRVELEQITDMMDNFEKFFGKWYMAKIYYLASGAFEIPRWQKLIQSRLDTVNDLYTMINNEKNRKKMMFLNLVTLFLFLLWFVI